MKLHTAIIIITLAILLIGCAATPPPAISDIRESMVKVQASLVGVPGTVDKDAVEAEAKRGCELYGRVATPISESCAMFDGYGICRAKEFLFTCNLE